MVMAFVEVTLAELALVEVVVAYVAVEVAIVEAMVVYVAVEMSLVEVAMAYVAVEEEVAVEVEVAVEMVVAVAYVVVGVALVEVAFVKLVHSIEQETSKLLKSEADHKELSLIHI